VARANESKANEFIDRRIGEERLSKEEAMLKRIVQERVRRSRKRSKFALEEDDDMEEGGLTHGVSVVAAVINVGKDSCCSYCFHRECFCSCSPLGCIETIIVGGTIGQNHRRIL
jgi:hypothetical protein